MVSLPDSGKTSQMYQEPGTQLGIQTPEGINLCKPFILVSLGKFKDQNGIKPNHFDLDRSDFNLLDTPPGEVLA